LPDMKKVGDWAKADPEGAMKVALKLGQTSAGKEVLKYVGRAWAERDPEAGLRSISALPAESAGPIGHELIAQWAQRDLAAAMRFVASQGDAAFRASLASGLVATWGKSDPAAALAWSNENLRGPARADAVSGLIKAAAEKDIATAAELVAGMEGGPAQNRACASIFETWFNKGKDQREAALEWLSGIDDRVAREAAFERVQWNWMWNDPAGAKEFLSGPYGKLASSQMVQQIARSQANRDPEAALAWANTLGDERAANARQAVLEGWLAIRPEGAAEYARKLAPGPDRERAIATVAQTFVWQSPQQAGAWYRSLPPADQKTTREIYNRMGLPPDKKAALEKALAE
jgi:hypothetical protein